MREGALHEPGPPSELLERAYEENARVNAFTQLAQREAPWPQTGKLRRWYLSVKDNIDVEGYYTTCALRAFSGHPSKADAAIVRRLRRQGALFLGKNNMHALALGATSTSSDYGPVRNPHDLSRIAGGSSGGSAAAVALGLVDASLGTDTGGSVRVPAALCGVVGFKPSMGRLSLRGVVPLSPSLDHVGILARSVALATDIFAAASGSRIRPRLKPPHKLKLGLPREGFLDGLDDKIADAFYEVREKLSRAGISWAEVRLPALERVNRLRGTVLLRESAWLYNGLARIEGALPVDVARLIIRGMNISRRAYLRALLARSEVIERVVASMQGVHALALPSVPIAAPKLEDVLGKEARWRRILLRNTAYFNYTGQPAISLPVPLGQKLFMGLQLVGLPGQDEELLSAALTVEALLEKGS
jgi:aspartyl-tRNA(Asn)/glutamyl-tRNA(Gln) amidotransferase subunit A